MVPYCCSLRLFSVWISYSTEYTHRRTTCRNRSGYIWWDMACDSLEALDRCVQPVMLFDRTQVTFEELVSFVPQAKVPSGFLMTLETVYGSLFRRRILLEYRVGLINWLAGWSLWKCSKRALVLRSHSKTEIWRFQNYLTPKVTRDVPRWVFFTEYRVVGTEY